jgi:hypothetical protein
MLQLDGLLLQAAGCSCVGALTIYQLYAAGIMFAARIFGSLCSTHRAPALALYRVKLTGTNVILQVVHAHIRLAFSPACGPQGCVQC